VEEPSSPAAVVVVVAIDDDDEVQARIKCGDSGGSVGSAAPSSSPLLPARMAGGRSRFLVRELSLLGGSGGRRTFGGGLRPSRCVGRGAGPEPGMRAGRREKAPTSGARLCSNCTEMHEQRRWARTRQIRTRAFV
jgi:hypothetical protein